ncbi:Hypothetical predicted protein [Olea europaea subsp. europaea]|uniref:Uncharacterized protein n=1 Tax=Olea europaea subsp. europaea TaxID=158383 RepID=A0A8S0TG04_OLEEU|nr:Hypothetical predicted protein [Olea europaea subsp. europaea]
MLVIRGGNISRQSRQQKSTHVGGTISIRGNNEHQEPDTPNDELGGENANDVSRALNKTRGTALGDIGRTYGMGRRHNSTGTCNRGHRQDQDRNCCREMQKGKLQQTATIAAWDATATLTDCDKGHNSNTRRLCR